MVVRRGRCFDGMTFSVLANPAIRTSGAFGRYCPGMQSSRTGPHRKPGLPPPLPSRPPLGTAASGVGGGAGGGVLGCGSGRGRGRPPGRGTRTAARGCASAAAAWRCGGTRCSTDPRHPTAGVALRGEVCMGVGGGGAHSSGMVPRLVQVRLVAAAPVGVAARLSIPQVPAEGLLGASHGAECNDSGWKKT